MPHKQKGADLLRETAVVVFLVGINGNTSWNALLQWENTALAVKHMSPRLIRALCCIWAGTACTFWAEQLHLLTKQPCPEILFPEQLQVQSPQRAEAAAAAGLSPCPPSHCSSFVIPRARVSCPANSKGVQRALRCARYATRSCSGCIPS